MSIDLSEAIQLLSQERGLSQELIHKTIEDTLRAAYIKRYGKDDTLVIRFEEGQVSMFERRSVVEQDDVYSDWYEIEIEDARKLNSDAEVGDEILVPVDTGQFSQFSRQSVQLAKQAARHSIKEIQNKTLYDEFKEKIGEIVIGYYQRERNGDIFVDLGKIEGKLSRKYQSSRETYHVNDRIKALIKEVNKTPAGLQIVLSRTDPDFVRAIFELEVPEVYDKTIEIFKIVREAGSRTKLAVYSNRDDVDPVGACVGLKGVRIQAVIKELEGEKIDILKYDPDPARFIKNALSPAEVRDVIILNEKSRKALAVVSDNVLSLAIGKQGMNVRLANKLTDWMIDVKTESQFAEMDIAAEARQAVLDIFKEDDEGAEEEISRISELPGVNVEVARTLLDNGVEYIADFLDLGREELDAMENVSEEQIETLRTLISELIEIQSDDGGQEYDGDEGEAVEEEAADEIECPECGAKFALDEDGYSAGIIRCPSCGAELELSFEKEEEERGE